MSDTAAHYSRLSAGFAAVVAAVPDDRWTAASPCEGWTARDVVRHVVETQGMFLRLVARDLGEIPSVDSDPAAARARIQDGLDSPDHASAEFDGFFGHTTFAEAVDTFPDFDLVVHRSSWPERPARTSVWTPTTSAGPTR